MNFIYALVASLFLVSSAFAQAPLLKEQLVYKGSIRTPHESSDKVSVKDVYPPDGQRLDGFNSGGLPFAIDFDRKEFVLGTRYSRVGRLKMVPPAFAIGGDANTLPVAPYVDGLFHDVSNNTWVNVGTDPAAVGPGLGGFLPYGQKLLVAGTIYYDAGSKQNKSVLAAEWPIDSIRPIAVTPWKTVGKLGQGLIAGPMAPVLGTWKDILPGDIIMGQAGLPIITRNSAGPCAINVKGSELVNDPAPATAKMLVCYPNGHWMPGHPWDGPGPDDYYTAATAITGMAFVGDNLVFAGSIGYGKQCYGNGTSDQSLEGKPSGDGSHWCYDPTASAKGNHAYPYRLQLWVYTKAQIQSVLRGAKAPWDLLPTIIKLDDVPFHEATFRTVGLAYDPSTRYLYVGSYAADKYGYEPGPVFHVYEVQGG